MVKVYKSDKGKETILETYDILLKKWEVSAEGKDVSTRFGTTHVIIAGGEEKPPLTLFHGVGDDAAMMWIRNAKALAADFRIYAVDTIGGPGKSIPNENYDKNFSLCEWIDDMLDSLNIEKTHMAGVSNGSYITQRYAAMRSDRINKLICMAGGLAAGDENPGILDMIKTMKIFFPEALFPTDKNMIKLINKLCGGNSDEFVRDKDIMAHWKALLKYFNQMAMTRHKLKLLDAQMVQSIKDRALFIMGDRDPIAYSEASISELQSAGIRYEVIKNAGHALNYEKPDIINTMMKEFLLG